MSFVYHCPDVVARYQVIEQLMDFSDKQIEHLRVTRTRDGFDVTCDELTDPLHAQIIERVGGISWEQIQ
jgi:hypothetical protein